MQILLRNKNPGAKFHHQVGAREFSSTLEIPNGSNALQNAWLTITINYELNFVDSRNLSSKAVLRNRQAFIKDADNDEFPLRDWDQPSRSDFIRRFDKGEDFWNYKFLLITPPDYDGFDFQCMSKGLVCRPNVICLFRLKSGGSPNHLTVDAVRPEVLAPEGGKHDNTAQLIILLGTPVGRRRLVEAKVYLARLFERA